MCVFGTGRREMRITWRGGLGRRMKSCKLDKFLESTAYCSSVHFRLEIIFELVICILSFHRGYNQYFSFQRRRKIHTGAERHLLEHQGRTIYCCIHLWALRQVAISIMVSLWIYDR